MKRNTIKLLVAVTAIVMLPFTMGQNCDANTMQMAGELFQTGFEIGQDLSDSGYFDGVSGGSSSTRYGPSSYGYDDDYGYGW